MKKILLFTFILIGSTLYSQTHTIYGTITDASNGESLISATISLQNSTKGVTSNSYGFYSLSLPKGNHTIAYQYLGYKTVYKQINITKDIRYNIELTPINATLNEVVVKAKKINHSYLGVNTLTAKQIRNVPTITGEPDVIKGILMLPGIQNSNQGSINFSVRGGNYDQNLILLDEAPVYNPSHALGFISTFNSDAIKNVTVYKGPFPSKYGGRLSSVVDIVMDDGDMKKVKINGGVGITASRLTIQGPIVKNKISYIISTRYSYVGQVLNLLSIVYARMYSNNDINFYDINAKINIVVNKNNKIFLSSYNGKDHFYCLALNNDNVLDWGNNTATLRWNHIYNSKLFSNITAYYSNYQYKYVYSNDIRDFQWNSRINETGLKADYSYSLNINNQIKFGTSIINHFFNPGEIKPYTANSVLTPVSLDTKKAIEFNAYLSNSQKIFNSLKLDYGIRLSSFFNIGSGIAYEFDKSMTQVIDSTAYSNGEIMQQYWNIEPRLTLQYKISESQSLKAGFGATSQYLHLLSNSSVGLPTDVWLPPDNNIKPETSNQYTLGYNYSHKQYFSFNAEVYYKTMNNIIDYVDNADIFMNSHIATQILPGKGKSYGLELLLKKNSGKLNGWIGYTLAKTTYKINGVNNNKEFSPRYDIRHNLSLNINYQLNKKWAVSSSFKLTSGGFITVPEGSFIYDNVAFSYFSGRNGYELPLYHRLDIMFKYSKPKAKKRWKSSWAFGFYNVYNRKNIYALFIRQHNSWLNRIDAYKMYLFGIVPIIAYNFKF